MGRHLLSLLFVGFVYLTASVPYETLAQTEYLVRVDVQSGELEDVSNVPTVRYVLLESSSFDHRRGHYYFLGIDTMSNHLVYSLEAATGNLVGRAHLPEGDHPWDNWIGLSYSSAANTMIGLHWDADTETEYFIHFDASDGSWQKISVIPEVQWVRTDITLDEINGRCFIQLSDSLRNWTLRTVDVHSGAVLASVPFPQVHGNLLCLEYSEQLETLVALHWDSITKTEHLVHVNPSDGHMTIVSTIPDVKWIQTSNVTFDQTHNQYIMTGADEDFNGWFITLDASTGEVVSKSDFPVFENEYDNLWMMEHDQLSDTVYALRWEMETPFNYVRNPIELTYPNPTRDVAGLVLNANYEEVLLFVHNTSGQLLWKDRYTYVKQLQVDVTGLSSGVYYLTTVCDRTYNGTTKLVVQ
ncbi:MAG: T9SS type A sorting domain-containing protein [Flavobacteriales bacterium]|nr:T9SS type A sorting domain-containing protein [Flavobacteriales bacterium]